MTTVRQAAGRDPIVLPVGLEARAWWDNPERVDRPGRVLGAVSDGLVLNGPVAPAPEVFSQVVEGEMVLLDSVRGRYYALDAVGARVWQLMVEERELAAVRARMLSEFDVDAATLDADLVALFDRLRSAGLAVCDDRP